MSWLGRLGNVFRSRRLNRDIDEELEFHLAMRARRLEEEGAPPENARREARRALGNALAVRERVRDADVLVFLETVLQDVRHALRGLARNPGFTLAAVVTLALGIGANAAVFGIVEAVVLRPLPYPEPERLVSLYQTHGREDIGRTRLAPLDFLDVQERSAELAALAGHIGTGFALAGDGEPEFVLGQLVSAELFDVLGVRPALGRALLPEENEAGRERVMVLSHGLWQRRFGGDPGVVGRTIAANGRSYRVVGVMPAGFDYPGERYQLWVPFPFRGANEDGIPINRDSRFVQVVGRLADGVAPERARAGLAGIARGLAAELPDLHTRTGFELASLTEETVGAVRPALLLLLGAVGFVLLLACANVTGLLLARAGAREREMAVRAALGGGGRRLARQLLTEVLVLYGLGAAAGLATGWGLLRAVHAWGPADVPRLGRAALDPAVLAVTGLVALAAALASGLAPAFQARRSAGAAGLGGWGGLGSRAVSAGPRRQRLRAAVIAGEVAISLMLLTGAGLAARSLLNLRAVDLGFVPERAVTFDVGMSPLRYPDADAMRRFHEDLIERFRAQPPVAAVGATTALPLSGQDLENSVAIEGRVPPAGTGDPVAGLRGVSPGYLEALGVRLVRGRSFTAEDRAGSPPVALVNQAFAERFWPGEDPVGKRIAVGGDQGPWQTVVGVVADVKHRALDGAARPEMLLPYPQLDSGFMTSWARGLSVVVRSEADPDLVADLVRRQLAALDPAAPAIRLRPMTALVGDSMAQPRFRALVLGGFAAIALALAATGVFGATSYFAAQRRREVGLRMALGARRGDVFAQVLGWGGRLAAAGLVLGLAGSAALTRWMASLLFEVSPVDPLTFAAAAALLATTALGAAWLPAARTARLDPAAVLRGDDPV